MKYKFKAIDTNGDIIEDIYIANSKEEAVEMIKSKNFLILAIEEDFQVHLNSLVRRKKVKRKDLVIFCNLFHTMLNAGINISKSFEIISENIENLKFKSALKEVNEDIHQGLNLSDAMARQKDIFPVLFIEMVRAGEMSGNLEEILLRLGDYYEKQNKIENKIKGALIYPSLLIVLSVVVVLFMLAFVLPVFFNIFDSNELMLPLPTQILIGISDIIHHHWKKLIVLIGIGVFAIRIYFKMDHGQTVLDQIKLKVPILRKLYIKIATANLTKTLSILLSAGLPLIKSLEMAGSVVNNIVIRKNLENEITQIEAGKLLSDAIKDTKIFSSVVHSMIKVGEETGTLDDILLKTSILYDEEINTSLEKLTKLIEPVLMIIVGLIIGFIVISLVLPMFDLMHSI